MFKNLHFLLSICRQNCLRVTQTIVCQRMMVLFWPANLVTTNYKMINSFEVFTVTINALFRNCGKISRVRVTNIRNCVKRCLTSTRILKGVPARKLWSKACIISHFSIRTQKRPQTRWITFRDNTRDLFKSAEWNFRMVLTCSRIILTSFQHNVV